MKIKSFNEKAKKFQEGGPMPAQPVENQAAAQVEQIAMQIVQELGPDVAAMVAEAIMQILQSQGGGEVAFQKRGGKLIKKTR